MFSSWEAGTQNAICKMQNAGFWLSSLQPGSSKRRWWFAAVTREMIGRDPMSIMTIQVHCTWRRCDWSMTGRWKWSVRHVTVKQWTSQIVEWAWLLFTMHLLSPRLALMRRSSGQPYALQNRWTVEVEKSFKLLDDILSYQGFKLKVSPWISGGTEESEGSSEVRCAGVRELADQRV